MIVKKEQSSNFTIPGGTEGRIYPSSPKGDQTIAYVTTDGVYPEKGWSINDKCTETIFMIEGAFELEVNDEKFRLEKDDLFIILPGNKYRIKGKGTALDLITPAWDKDQNKIIDN